ncbi:MAG: hypothetical protein KDE09_23400 [Anaerolineales bacterium]|nr:hypothetical protein [Anaerolineales bacterium]
MSTGYIYPFGQSLTPVQQQDRRPKKVFVLGVYASAVHARWRGPDGKVLVQALAVASEPDIFWRGEGAAEIVERIVVPASCGWLEPAGPHLNGPSGRTLDEQFLAPLGYRRHDAWLADLLPETRLNPSQQKAIARAYEPYVQAGLVPPVAIPPVPSRFANAARVASLAAELIESSADLLVTLGDVPLREFVAAFQPGWRRLAQFGETADRYGRIHELAIAGKQIRLLPLVHPRQAGGLGHASAKWRSLHQQWRESHHAP